MYKRQVLGGTPEPGGTWSPALASGTSIFDPAVDPPGVYTYIIDSVSTCPDVSSQVTITINDPFDISTCDITDETIECDGDLNETIADQWHEDNLDALTACINNPNITITHNYLFTNIVTTCGAGGTITVNYSITDDCGNPSSIEVTITLEDTTPPDLSNCDVENEEAECGTPEENEAFADQWNADNIAALETCAGDACNTVATVTVTSDYDFDLLNTTCGPCGTLTVNYTVADDCGNETVLTAVLAFGDSTGPDTSNL